MIEAWKLLTPIEQGTEKTRDDEHREETRMIEGWKLLTPIGQRSGDRED